MADIFISYTSSDRDWAFWIGHELEALGHVAHVHEWEIPAGGDIMAWMVKRHEEADHILCVVSRAYFDKPYSSLERLAAQWAATSDRPGFALPVFIEDCKPPTLLAHIRRCDLYGLNEEKARERLKAFLAPVERPAEPPRFPGTRTTPQTSVATRAPAAFPPNATLSNIPITVPRHFVGRDEALKAIATALASSEGRAAVTALHGLRGVGKTTLAATYAERHRGDYRATWWIRAQTPDGMRADLVALGVQLGWVDPDEKEQPAVESVMERLREEGGRILLIYDNAIGADELRPYLPLRGAAQVLITSNAPGWRAIAEPVEIKVWPKEIGADYLIARTGRTTERAAAEGLSGALGGLPLAHEQAAAYCERLEVPLAEYQKRFDAAPARLLDDARDAPRDYHDRTTVAKTFALAIDEAAKLHPAAEPLIVHAALLASEPIPLFLFAEGRENFGEPFASALTGDGLDEAVAALRAFALVDREGIPDERDPAIITDCIRLHRLVRQVAHARRNREATDSSRLVLFEAMAAVFPAYVWRDPETWPRTRRLDPHALALFGADVPPRAEATCADLLIMAGQYRQYGLAAYAQAKPLFERALALCEKSLGMEHPKTASALMNVAGLLQDQGDRSPARALFERALVMNEKLLGPEDPATAACLNNLALLLQDQGDLAGARPLYERTLAIYEKVFGPDHPPTATILNNLALLLQRQDDLAGAQLLHERALAMCEKLHGPEHPDTGRSLNNLALVLENQGNLAAARPLFERSLTICLKVFGAQHPNTAQVRTNLGNLLLEQKYPTDALRLAEAALDANDKVLGREHPSTKSAGRVTADALDALGRSEEAAALRKRYGIEEGGKRKRSTGRLRKRRKAGSTARRARRKVR